MIYKSIAAELRKRINSSDFAIGDPLPSEKALASSFAVSRMTIRRAVAELIAHNLVSRLQGKGTFVISKDSHFEIAELKSFHELVNDAKSVGKTEVLDFQIMNAPLSIATKLKIATDEKILYSRRVRFINGTPVMVEDSYMPFRLFKNLSIAHLEQSKFHFIEKICQIPIAGSYESCYAMMPDEQISALLKIKTQQPVLLLTTLSYSADDERLNYAVIYRNTHEHTYQYHLKRHN